MKNLSGRMIFRVSFALLALIAVVTQLVYGISHTNLNPVNFLSYFTIESNIFALSVLLVAAWMQHAGRRDRGLDYLRGAATLYMLITGLIYSILLSGVDVNTPLPWVNTVLHYIMPVVMLIDWLTDKPSRKIPGTYALLWLLFPLLYFAYSLIRGHFVGWYPYPFMNAEQIGYGEVALNSLFIAAGMVLLSLAVARIGARQMNANGPRKAK